MERACRRAQLSQSLSSGVSSSPLTQPLRASEYLVWTKVQGFPSGASGRGQRFCGAGCKGQCGCCSLVSQSHSSGPSLLQNLPSALVCLSAWNNYLLLCFFICTIMSATFLALHPFPVFVKPLKNATFLLTS